MRRSLLAALLAITSAVQADDYLIEKANVLISPIEAAPEGTKVLIKNDRIVAVGPNIAVPAGVRRIDGSGKWLMPGLTEMHAHLPRGGAEEAETQETLFLYLAGGVTTVRGMLGAPEQFNVRDAIKRGDIAGPTFYLAAPSLNGDSVRSADEGREKVAAYADEGWDLLKIHPGLSLAEYQAVAEAAKEKGIRLGGHVPQDVGILNALAAGQSSIDHMDGYIFWLGGQDHVLTDEELAEAVKVTLQSGTVIVPTQALFNLLRSGGDKEALLARPENRYMRPDLVKAWGATVDQIALAANAQIAPNRDRLLKAFADGGVKIALGSDAPQIFSVPGFSVMREIEAMRHAGMTDAQILEAALTVPAAYFKDQDCFGVVKTTCRADLILVDGDPRSDAMAMTRLSGVMAAGRWYSRERIDSELANIAERHASE